MYNSLAYHSSNFLPGGTVKFFRNIAREGGALRNMDSILNLRNAYYYFENNTAVNGGAMYLAGASTLMLESVVNISFILNHAHKMGGALYIEDSKCSTGSTHPIICFLKIESDHGPNYVTKNILLLFF